MPRLCRRLASSGFSIRSVHGALIGVIIVLSALSAGSASQDHGTPVSDPRRADCTPTTGREGDPGTPEHTIPGFVPAGIGTPAIEVWPDENAFYGNDGLWVGLWPEGIVRVAEDSGYLTAGGGVGMKFWWYRDDSAPGTLRISGYRQDGDAPPLQASIPEGYGNVGFQATGLVFPTPGCWIVTGTTGTASLTFVTLVEIVPTTATPQS